MGKDQELLEAARKGNVAVVEKILGQRAKRSGPLASLRRGPGANVQDSSGYSALHHASLNGHKEIVKLLLEHDASTNIVDVKGSSPLHLAAWSGNVDIVRLLLSGPSICNVNLTTKDDETALHCAAQYGHTMVVSLLLEHACDPGIRNCRGETALDLAAQYGRLETVELLVRTDPSLIQCLRRAAPDTVYPHTPLHLASRNGHKSVVEVLLGAGFSVNTRTKSGTALHEAALCGKVEVVRTLLEHGVNTAIRDSHNYTVMDLLSQFNTAQASQEIMGILKRHKRGITIVDSDGESISHPFPTMPNTDSDIGSPYENVRPSSKNARSTTTDPSPGTSPQRWNYQRHARPPEGFEDRRVSGVSGISMRNSKPYQSLPHKKRMSMSNTSRSPPDITPLDGITFSFSEQLALRKFSTASSTDSYYTACDSVGDERNSNSSRESDNSLYQIPCVPRAFMDSSVHSEDLHYLCTSRESDQISLSSTASSSGYPRRPDSGGVPLYIPMNSVKGGHSPSSNSKVSPTPPKKPPRRNLSVSPTHLQPMSMSVDGVSNSAYEYLFLAHSGTRSQGNLSDVEHESRRERLTHGRSVDQYVEMNVFNIALDEDEDRPKELHRGKSEDLDCRKRPEPVAITSMYENMIIKQQNPRRKLRRNPEVYEEYDFRKQQEPIASCSAPEPTFVSNAFIMVSGESDTKTNCNYPMSPTHYKQPPTPDHPPPSALQAESIIYEKIRPLSQNGVVEDTDLSEMGITSELERQIILDAVKQLPFKIHSQTFSNNNNNEQNSVQSWLSRIHLEQYYDTFNKHLYHDMERIKRIWDVELSAVLDIEKIGHRKRILASVSSGEHIISGPKLEDINIDLNLLKGNQNQQLKSPSAHSTGTIKHRHKKSRPAPPPPIKIDKEPEKRKPTEMFVGGNNSIKSQWRHQPILLITGVVMYSANYLGSVNVIEFKGTESTKKSIQKVVKGKDRPNEEITLSISYRGVKFVNPGTKNTICEHEIRNINCACQDGDNQCYFAYITKDGDCFYCHVFQATSSEQATEIILTLGQAFELAYQMAVREQVTSKSKHHGRDSHKPAVSPGAVSSHSRDFKDMKMNGHPLKMKPLTLSIAADPDQQKTPTKSNFADSEE